MPLQVLDGLKAIETLKANAFSSWPARGDEANRLQPFAAPDFRPSFVMQPHERIFTIGSCFARNVENALLARGFGLPAREALKADPEFLAFGPNILNNYGIPSIYNEILWALRPGTFDETASIIEISPGKYVDIHLNQALRPVDLITARHRRHAIMSAYAAIESCQIVIITLGLTECWFDVQSKLYLNTAPRRQLVRQFPGRFELHVLNYEESWQLLSKTIGLIKEFGRPDGRVIITVSPVPLQATYRDMDVIQANMFSKSVLRVVAEAASVEFDFVDYFPSFESILTSDREVIWEDDQVHIKKSAIDFNIARMVARYAPQSAEGETAEDLVGRLRNEPSPNAIFLQLESLKDLLQTHEELALLFVESAIRIKRVADADWGARFLSSSMFGERVDWCFAQISFLKEDFAKAEAQLLALSATHSRKGIYWQMLMKCHFQLGNSDGVKSDLKSWAIVYPRSPEPYRQAAVYLGQMEEWPEAEYCFRKAKLLDVDGDAAVALDFAEYQASRGRIMMSRREVEAFTPRNPLQQARLEELLLRVGKSSIRPNQSSESTNKSRAT